MTEIGESVFATIEKVERIGALKVTVLNICNNEPIEGVTVFSRNKIQKTNKSGQVVFNNLHPGLAGVRAVKEWPHLNYVNFLINYPPVSLPKDADSVIYSSVVLNEGNTELTIHMEVFRKVEKVIFKRKHIDLGGEDQYGHWWTEIDDSESYGWWPKYRPGHREVLTEPPTPPDPLPPNANWVQRAQHRAEQAWYNAELAWFQSEPLRNQISDTFGGVEGELNGQTTFGGSPTIDPHHGDDSGDTYQPIISDCRTDAAIKECIRGYASSYSGQWAWRFEFGQNCHSFQVGIIDHCDLENLIVPGEEK